MGTLRVAFLSGMVLELLTTLSVAVVAVGIGLRLVEGQLDLFTGLAVLIMAPEVYLPLRQVGLHFHASTDGIAAADAAFEILEEPLPMGARVEVAGSGAGAEEAGATVPAMFADNARLELVDVCVRAPGRDVLAPAHLTATIPAGRITVFAGPNGAGKTTTVLTLLGLLTPDAGQLALVTPDGTRHDLSALDRTQWHAQITWVPQRPVLPPGTVTELVLGGDLVLDDDGAEHDDGAWHAAKRAAGLTGLDEVIAGLPAGWNTRIGQGGYGLSVGQRQRLALTRALVSNRPIVILDEPTAHLDSASEDQIHAALRELRDQGRTVILIAHRPGLLELADSVVQIRSESVPAQAAL